MNYNGEREQLYREALNRWGGGFQALMVIEEAAELVVEISSRIGVKRIETLAEGIKAQSKGLREHASFISFASPTANPEPLLEEVADVEIMMEQLRLMLDADGRIEELKQEKLKRLAGMLGRKQQV